MMVVTALEVVRNAIFIHLKMPTQQTKIAQEEDELRVNDTSSRLNPRN
jgi:hypothetical protein